MRGMLAAIAAMGVVALLANSALAQSDPSADKKSDGPFTGIAIVTDDLDWYDLFRRPETPRIRGRDRFVAGETGAVALVFSNALPEKGTVRVECDITAFDPDGSKVVVDSGVCYEGPYHGDNILHPSLLDLRFRIESGDTPGTAGFVITLRDTHSNRDVELNVSYTQAEGQR